MNETKPDCCKEVIEMGYIPDHYNKDCCATCHSSFMPNRGFHEIVYRKAFILKVCCSVKRAIEMRIDEEN